LIDLLREEAGSAVVVLVVGHEPTMSETALWLAGPGSNRTAWSQIERKFPTGGVAVLRVDEGWGALSRRGAALETFAVPREG
jgi:phosphohistidine phosphatase